MVKKKGAKNSRPPLLFISYSHNDDECRQRLRIHLKVLERSGILRVFDDTLLTRDTGWHDQLLQKLNEAELVIMLVSPDFLASDFCFAKEWPIARKRWTQKKAIVTFALISPCQWKETDIGDLQGVPSHGKLLPNDKRGEAHFWDEITTALRKDASECRVVEEKSNSKKSPSRKNAKKQATSKSLSSRTSSKQKPRS